MMNRSTIMKIGAAVCVIALCVCCAAIAGRGILGGNRYEDADKYTAGGAVIGDAVKKLDIHWIDGKVNFVQGTGSAIEISETSKNPISGDKAMRWRVDGDTLRVQYAKSGFISFKSLNKELTVALPEGVSFEDVQVESTSADVIAPELRTGAVAVNLTSGDLSATLEGAKTVQVGSTSGTIRLSLADAADSVALSSTSGDIGADIASAKALTASTTSGSVSVTAGAVEKASLSSTSGDITASVAAFDALKIDATSGNVTATLPEEPGFSAEISTTSGSFDSSLPLKQDGKRYACGDESGQLKIDTTSGDVHLLKAE